MTDSSKLNCTIGCWGIAAIAGVVTAAALGFLGDYGIEGPVFLGLIMFGVVGGLLSFFVCTDLPAPENLSADEVAPTPTPAPPAPKTTMPLKATPVEAIVKPSTPLPGEAELSERKGAWSYSKPQDTAQTEGRRPESLEAPRDGAADDLKKIKGVGPKLEAVVHGLGYYHFDQIAGWGPEEVAWVDENLEGFKGRVTRDNWVEQAKLLAAGGETEFSKKVDEGEVY